MENKLIFRKEALISMVPLGATSTTLILLLMLQHYVLSSISAIVNITVKVAFIVVTILESQAYLGNHVHLGLLYFLGPKLPFY